MVIIRTQNNEDLEKVKSVFRDKSFVDTPESNILLSKENDEDYTYRGRVAAVTCENEGMKVIVEVFQGGKAERIRVQDGNFTYLHGIGIDWGNPEEKQETPVEEAPAEETEENPALESTTETEPEADAPVEPTAEASTETMEESPAEDTKGDAGEQVAEDAVQADSADEAEKEDPADESEEDDEEDSDEEASNTGKKQDAKKKKEPKKKFVPADPSKHKVPPFKSVPETSYTMKHLVKKLDEEKAKFPASALDCIWTIERLEKMCETDQDLIQYIMQKNKTFAKAFDYIMSLAKNKEIGNIYTSSGGYGNDLPREEAIKYFIEYYKLDEDEVDRLKKEKAAKQAEANKAAQEARLAEIKAKTEEKKETVAKQEEKKPAPEKPVKKAADKEKPSAKKDGTLGGQISFFDDMFGVAG